MAIVSRVDYGSAEVRGQLRQWKKKLARGYADFDAAYRRLQAVDLTVDMVKSPCAAASSSIACSVPASIETLAFAGRPMSRGAGEGS
jgi:hypothetical protein